MNVFSFGAQFTDEESCSLQFKEQRDKEGVLCKRCDSTNHYWLIYKIPRRSQGKRTLFKSQKWC